MQCSCMTFHDFNKMDSGTLMKSKTSMKLEIWRPCSMTHVNLVLLYLEQLVKTQWNVCSLHASSKIRTLCLSAGKSSCMTVSCLWCFCNTSRFLMILRFGIWPLCLHKQDQAFGIKRPLRQCPCRIWFHNLPVQVPASRKHGEYNAMEIQHFSHSLSLDLYIIV